MIGDVPPQPLDDDERSLLSPTFAVVMIASFAYFTAMGALLPTVPRFVEDELGGGGVAVGVGVGAYAVSAAVLRPWVGRLGDTKGRRLLAVGGSIVVAVVVRPVCPGHQPVDAGARPPRDRRGRGGRVRRRRHRRAGPRPRPPARRGRLVLLGGALRRPGGRARLSARRWCPTGSPRCGSCWRSSRAWRRWRASGSRAARPCRRRRRPPVAAARRAVARPASSSSASIPFTAFAVVRAALRRGDRPRLGRRRARPLRGHRADRPHRRRPPARPAGVAARARRIALAGVTIGIWVVAASGSVASIWVAAVFLAIGMSLMYPSLFTAVMARGARGGAHATPSGTFSVFFDISQGLGATHGRGGGVADQRQRAGRVRGRRSAGVRRPGRPDAAADPHRPARPWCRPRVTAAAGDDAAYVPRPSRSPTAPPSAPRGTTTTPRSETASRGGRPAGGRCGAPVASDPMADVAFVLHGHFYQPPRENPWTEVVPRQPTAAPFHDWNERITAECYRPNGWARILDDHGRIVAIVDNYEHLSFNVGPTLHVVARRPRSRDVYARIVDADRAGPAGHRPGVRPRHPAAVQRPRPAHPGPLGPRRLPAPLRPAGRGHVAARDRGRRRMLAVLAEEGVRVHDPGARARSPRCGASTATARGWRPGATGGVDAARHGAVAAPRRPGPRRRPRRSTTAPISHDVAFGGFPSQVVVGRIVGRSGGELVSVACDGETFGHHHHYADRGVAYALAVEADRRGVGAAPAGRLAGRAPADPRGAGPRVGVVVRPRRRAVDGGLRLPHRRRARLEPGVAGPAAGRARPAARRRGRGVRAARPRGARTTRGRPATPTSTCCSGVTTIERVRRRARARRRRAPGRGAHAAREPAPRAADVHVVRLVLQRPGRPRDRADPALRGLLLRPAGRAGRAAAGRRRSSTSWPRRRATSPTRATGATIWRRHVDTSRVDPGRVVAHLALTELLAGAGDPGPVGRLRRRRATCTTPSTGAAWRCARAGWR